jgi:hypothetical protein
VSTFKGYNRKQVKQVTIDLLRVAAYNNSFAGIAGIEGIDPLRVVVRTAAVYNRSFAGIAGIEGIDPLQVVVRTAAVCSGDDATLFIEDRYGVSQWFSLVSALAYFSSA